MPLIFLEYKPLCSEREFTRFWEFISEGQKNDGSIEESRLFKIREGLFLGMINFKPKYRDEIMSIYGDTGEEGTNLKSLCKSIRLKYNTKELL